MSRGPQEEGRAVARPGRGTRRRAHVAAAITTCLLLAVPAAASAAPPASAGPAAAAAKAKAKKKTKAKKLSVKVAVVNTTQKGVVGAKKVKVKITASGKASTVVRAKVGKTTGITKTAKVTFKKKGSRSLYLKLSSKGLTKLKACGAPKLVVEVTYGKKKATKTRTLSKSATFCKTTTPPVVKPPDIPVKPIDIKPAGNCDAVDPLDDSTCLLPWPNDFYTRADASAQTGRRLDLQANEMPQSSFTGKGVDVTPYNRADGFSANSAILTKVPGLNTKQGLDASGAAQIGDIGRSLEADAPIVVINATTGARTPIWSEIDVSNQGASANPGKRLLITRAAKVFDEGTRYIVAMRNLKTADGTPIPAGLAFQRFRDNTVPADAPDAVKARQAHMDEIFAKLGAAGIDRSSLYLAWDFTTGSQDNLSGPALKMRDEAFDQLGDTDLSDRTVQGSSPQFTFKSEENYSHSESHYVLRRVDGTIKVPCFMGNIDFNGKNVGYCGPGTTINWGPDNKPVQARDAGGNLQSFEAPVTCIIPRAGKDSDEMATDKQAITFGHGLLGDATTLTSVKDRAGVDKAVICGTDWIGMAKGDIPTVLQALPNMSNFPAIAERSVQSLLNFLYLGRWMISQAPGGLNDTDRFKPTSGVLVDPAQRLYNLGGSQGGIMGGALTALSPDFDRSVLDVPAVGYTTLLNRSAAGAIFAPTLSAGYKDPAVQQVVLSLAQTIWDRGEGGGYVHHITTDALPDTPQHKVIILEAFGDHLVSNIQTETEARTVGAILRTPALDPNRSLDKVPYWGLATEPAESFSTANDGFDAPAVLIPIDIGPKRVEGGNNRGVDPEPQANIWPTDGFGPGGNGTDPHADVATSNLVLTLLRDFLRPTGGVITDQPYDPTTNLGGCGLAPCYAEGWTGPTP